MSTLTPFKLSPGAVAAIKRNQLPAGAKLVLQVLTCTPFQVRASTRYKLEISDGQTYTLAMLATQHNDLVKSQQLKENSIIRIREFITNEVQSKQIVILLDVEVVEQSASRVGAPKEFDAAGGVRMNNSNPVNNRVFAPAVPAPANASMPSQAYQAPQQQQQQQFQAPQVDCFLYVVVSFF
jgi:hypothetical protein